MLCASLVTSAGNRAAPVSTITCRKQGSAVREIALRLTITTSAQDGSAASARTTAAPTSPVPPMIKTRNAILALYSVLALSPVRPSSRSSAHVVWKRVLDLRSVPVKCTCATRWSPISPGMVRGPRPDRRRGRHATVGPEIPAARARGRRSAGRGGRRGEAPGAGTGCGCLRRFAWSQATGRTVASRSSAARSGAQACRLPARRGPARAR